MNLYAIMHTDIGENSDYEPTIVAVAQDYEHACHVADLKHDELKREFEENFPNRELDVEANDGVIRAIDENCCYGWILKVQQIMMDVSFTVIA